MPNRKDYYFRQPVTEGELDGGFDGMEDGIHDRLADIGLAGIITGGNVVEHSPSPDFTVDIDGPLISYDQLGRRVAYVTANQNLDMNEDENGADTSVPTPGESRVLTIFVEFDRNLTDKREDGAGNPVFFVREESFIFNVVAGAAATTGTETPVGYRPDQLLLADITIAEGQTLIEDADIDLSRRQDLIILTGTPTTVRTGSLKTALQEILDAANNARPIPQPLMNGLIVENFAPTAEYGVASASDAASWLMGVVGIDVGDKIVGVRARLSDTGRDGTLGLYKREPGGGATLITELSTMSGSEVTVLSPVIDVDIVDLANYTLVAGTGNTGVGTFTVHSVTIERG